MTKQYINTDGIRANMPQHTQRANVEQEMGLGLGLGDYWGYRRNKKHITQVSKNMSDIGIYNQHSDMVTIRRKFFTQINFY